jgi:hypothetical protein
VQRALQAEPLEHAGIPPPLRTYLDDELEMHPVADERLHLGFSRTIDPFEPTRIAFWDSVST